MGNIQSFLFCFLPVEYCVSYQQSICSCMSYIVTYNKDDSGTWMLLEQPALVEGSLPTADGLELHKL